MANTTFNALVNFKNVLFNNYPSGTAGVIVVFLGAFLLGIYLMVTLSALFQVEKAFNRIQIVKPEYRSKYALRIMILSPIAYELIKQGIIFIILVKR